MPACLCRCAGSFVLNPQSRKENTIEHITLFYRQDLSDKKYVANIQPQDGGYVVQFQYGLRGSALQSGQKNAVPVPYEKAKSIYDQLVAGKLRVLLGSLSTATVAVPMAKHTGWDSKTS